MLLNLSKLTDPTFKALTIPEVNGCSSYHFYIYRSKPTRQLTDNFQRLETQRRASMD